MTISGVGSANPYSATQMTKFQQSRTDFQALGSALASGDLSSAQSALSAFLKDVQNGSSDSGPFASDSQAGKDLQALQSALQSGDVKGAQSAFSTLQKDLQSMRPHGHHHNPSGSGSDTAQPSTASASTPDITATNSASSAINMLL